MVAARCRPPPPPRAPFARPSPQGFALSRLAAPAQGSPEVSPQSGRGCVASSRVSRRQRTGSRGRWETGERASQSLEPETTLLRGFPRRSPRELARIGSLGRRPGLQHRRHFATFPGASGDSTRLPPIVWAPRTAHRPPPRPPAHPAGRAGSGWGWEVGNSVNGKGADKAWLPPSSSARALPSQGHLGRTPNAVAPDPE